VCEAGRRVRLAAVEGAADCRGDLGGIVGRVRLLPELTVRLAAIVELLRPDRGGADVESEDGAQRSTSIRVISLTSGGSASATRVASARSSSLLAVATPRI
jgi:hypothetical protein